MKPKVLYLTDVKGWGGYTRGKAYQKHLSDEFDITMKTLKSVKPTDVKDFDVFWLAFHPMLQYAWVQNAIKRTKCICTCTSNIIVKDKWSVNKFKKMVLNVNMMCINNLRINDEMKKYYYGPIHYTPRGVDEKLFKSHKWGFTSFKAVYVGKPTLEKGLKTIIEPVCHAAGVQLIQNTHNFKTMIPHRKMPALYNNGHVYIVASTSDGTPNPALEAASCGRPIIANRIGNMPEFIEDGENGFLVNLNIDEYVEKLLWMKSHPQETYQMGLNARKTIEDNWTWKKVINLNERKALQQLLGI